jgi:hypothetical protein
MQFTTELQWPNFGLQVFEWGNTNFVEIQCDKVSQYIIPEPLAHAKRTPSGLNEVNPGGLTQSVIIREMIYNFQSAC